MRRSKLLFYRPGLISLIALPVLLIPFSFSVTPNGGQRALEIIAYQGKAPQRNNIEILLTGNENSDRVKLDFCKVMMSEIISRRDTVLGIHIRFEPLARYKSLVRIINDFSVIDHASYIFDGHQVRGYYLKRDSVNEVHSFICGTSSKYARYDCTPELNVMNSISKKSLIIMLSSFVLLAVCSLTAFAKFA